MASADFTIKQGATRPYFKFRILDPTGSGLDVFTGSPVLTFRFWHIEDATGLGGTLTALDPATQAGQNGWVEYHWAALDTAKAGLCRAVVSIPQGGDTLKVPNEGYMTIQIDQVR